MSSLQAVVLFDIWWPRALGLLAVALLVSGLDDLIPVLICLRTFWQGKKTGSPAAQPAGPPAGERRLAIFVPCWAESAAIGKMVRHNLAAIRYPNFDVFLGVYPNDPATKQAADELAAAFGNVHVAECSSPGPTSKADCLNSVYRRMRGFEIEHAVSFDSVVLHDAEDLIHPEALSVINRERAHYKMVQVPVLPLATSFAEATHGIYCDEFAEFQTIDMRARELSGAFVPSNGVGTAFACDVLAELARARNDQVFDPTSLTEDYEIGYRIHAAGFRQRFHPLERCEGDLVATREYFPRVFGAAVRQRTRWLIGIALQSWERHGWRGSWGTKYWFWRDRKGILTNPVSVVANAIFIAGLGEYVVSSIMHTPWLFTVTDRRVAFLCVLTAGLYMLRLAIRMFCVAGIFGWSTAAAVPLRTFHANLVNCTATVRALWIYWRSRVARQSVAWQKTDHVYPEHHALQPRRRALLDVLTGQGYLSNEQASQVQAQLSAGGELDLLLLANGLVSEGSLCQALSLQSGLPAASIDFQTLNIRILRGLPAHAAERFQLIPFAVKRGRLLVATPRAPSPEACAFVESLSDLPVECQLVTPSTYRELEMLAKRGGTDDGDSGRATTSGQTRPTDRTE